MAGEQRTAEKSSVHYIKDIEQTERWRREFVNKKEYEVSLAAVSKLSYEAVDYEPLLESAPFADLRLSNYDYLYGQAVQRVESEFFMPIAVRIAGFIGIGIVLVVFFSMIMLGVTTVLGGVIAMSLYKVKKDKALAFEQAHEIVTDEIKRRHEEETRVYDEAKKNYERIEEDRIDSIRRLLTGNPNAINLRIDDAFKAMSLPVLVEADIEHYNNVPLVKVWLPAKAVVPLQSCELLPSGRIQYKDKELRTYNKQYFELVTAIVMRVTLNVLANVPSFEYCYAWGLVKTDSSDDCLLTLKATRENAADAGRVGSALNALQFMDVKYSTDTNFMMTRLREEKPDEWKDAEQKNIYSIRVKIFK